TAVLNGISNIQNVTGSGKGNSLIVGDANPNVLVGGNGRNIIIGGAGAGNITGGKDFKILFGGKTLWGEKNPAPQAMFQFWNSLPPGAFDQGVNALRKGIVVNNKTYALNSTTVFADASPDSLNGGAGQNWFLFDFDDVINNGNGPGPNDRWNKV